MHMEGGPKSPLLFYIPAALLHILCSIQDQEGKGKRFGQQQPRPILSTGLALIFYCYCGKQKGSESKNVFTLQTDFPPSLSYLLLQVKFEPADLDKCPFQIRQKRIHSLK